MNIKVRNEELGECNIKTYIDIDKEAEYLIKSLCMFQLLCMNSKEDPEKFDEFINILREATAKTDELFNDELSERKYNGTEQFDG